MLLDAKGGEVWRAVYQIVVLRQYRNKVLHLVHESPLAGNLRYWKVLQHFYWPGLRRDVVTFVQSATLAK